MLVSCCVCVLCYVTVLSVSLFRFNCFDRDILNEWFDMECCRLIRAGKMYTIYIINFRTILFGAVLLIHSVRLFICRTNSRIYNRICRNWNLFQWAQQPKSKQAVATIASREQRYRKQQQPQLQQYPMKNSIFELVAGSIKLEIQLSDLRSIELGKLSHLVADWIWNHDNGMFDMRRLNYQMKSF